MDHGRLSGRDGARRSGGERGAGAKFSFGSSRRRTRAQRGIELPTALAGDPGDETTGRGASVTHCIRQGCPAGFSGADEPRDRATPRNGRIPHFRDRDSPRKSTPIAIRMGLRSIGYEIRLATRAKARRRAAGGPRLRDSSRFRTRPRFCLGPEGPRSLSEPQETVGGTGPPRCERPGLVEGALRVPEGAAPTLGMGAISDGEERLEILHPRCAGVDEVDIRPHAA
jgi:hypothetical protein